MSFRPCRLPPGADLRRGIEALAATLPEASAFVVSGIGSLTNARLRMANEAGERLIARPLEILTLAGSVTADGAHLHMAVANAAGAVLGGHVGYGCEVRTTAELLLAELADHRLSREPDATTGYKELVVHRCNQGDHR